MCDDLAHKNFIEISFDFKIKKWNYPTKAKAKTLLYHKEMKQMSTMTLNGRIDPKVIAI